MKNWCWKSNTLANWCEELTPWKRLWWWERLKAGGEGDNGRWDGWMDHQFDAPEFEQAPGVGDRHGSLACCSPWGHKESDTTEWLNYTDWTVAHQAPLSMGFSKQEYWSGLPCPLPGDLLDPGIKPKFLMSLALAGMFFTTSANWEALKWTWTHLTFRIMVSPGIINPLPYKWVLFCEQILSPKKLA